MKPDWTKAPEWANYHAFDVDGRGHWFEVKPAFNYNIWELGVGRFLRNFDFVGPEETLESRP